MIIKPAIQFLNKHSDSRLVVGVNTVIFGLTDNDYYPNPLPPLSTVQSALDEFSGALSDAADGGVTLTSIKNAKRAALVTLMRQLASYVQVTCNGSMTVLLTSGFPTQKPHRQPVGVPSTPSQLKVTFGARMGELNCVVAPVFGASTYNWRIAAASAPDVILQSAQTTGGRYTFSGLMPGMTYHVRVNAVATAGVSDWSKPGIQMAM
jgi:Fibronectin type III domain